MIKIAFFIHTLGRGGAEQVLLNLVNNLDKKIYKVTVYTIINTGNLISKLSKNIEVISIFKLPNFLLDRHTNNSGTLVKGTGDNLSFASKLYAFSWRYFSKLISLYAGTKIKNHDLYISYLEGPTNILISNIDFDGPKMAWVHVDLEKERKSEIFYKSIEANRLHYSKFDYIVAVSDDVKYSLMKYIGVDREPKVIYNTYDDKLIRTRSQIKLSELDLSFFDQNKKNIVTVGRLSKQKGFDRLIEAIENIKNKDKIIFDELNIIIVGDGEEKDKLQKKIDGYNLNNTIKMVGYKSNPLNFIRKADAFMCSSRTEGFSTVVVESLIVGTPVFTTDCSGMREILDDGNLGVIEENNIYGIEKLLKKTFEKTNIKNFDSKETNLGLKKFNLTNSIEKHQLFFEYVLGRAKNEKNL